jgi:hypothetical protein
MKTSNKATQNRNLKKEIKKENEKPQKPQIKTQIYFLKRGGKKKKLQRPQTKLHKTEN